MIPKKTSAAKGADRTVGKALLREKRGRGRPRDMAKEDAILHAAQGMFLKNGFDGASVDAIAEAACVAKATVYARFGDKESLLRAAIELKCAEFFEEGEIESRPARPLRQELLSIAHRFLALVTDRDALAMHALMMDAAKTGPELPMLFFESAVAPTCSWLTAYLQAECARGRLTLDDPEAAAWRFLGMVKGQDHMRAMLGLPRRSQGEIDAFLGSCVDAFLAAHEVRGGAGAATSP